MNQQPDQDSEKNIQNNEENDGKDVRKGKSISSEKTLNLS